MALPSLPKQHKRDRALTVRISEICVNNLKALAQAHNLSQSDVIEYLINDEMDRYRASKGAPKGNNKRT